MRAVLGVVVLGFACCAALHVPQDSTSAALQRRQGIESSLREHAEQLARLTDDVVPEMMLASHMLAEGICFYRGFCKSNPALSCQDVMRQEGIEGHGPLPDGQYWLKDESFSSAPNATFRASCKMTDGGGWTLLFDERGRQAVTQHFHPHVANLRFKEVLVYTVDDVAHNRDGTVSYFYNVDEDHPDHHTSHGFTPNQMLTAPWVGQDDYGKSVGGHQYPQYAQHFRFKYFGKPNHSHSTTLYVLDDGDIGPAQCRDNAPEGKGTCYFDFEDSKLAQSCLNKNGVIAFGCSDDQASFTQCGSCVYNGAGDKAELTRRSLVQVMYVR